MTFGTCRYCGQVVNLDYEEETQAEADIAASEKCECYDARHERNLRKQITARPYDKIFDSHLGSGSSRIAAYDMALDFIGCEIDAEYFQKQEQRFEEHTAQQRLFL